MQRVKVGFIPSHRVPFSDEWAVKMRGRCLAEMAKVPGLDVVVPDPSLTEGGLVRSLSEARKTLDLFKRQEVAGVIVGGMTFGHETSAVGVTIAGMPAGTPVLQFATKGEVMAEGKRPSDSWCGQFMIASALKRRHIRFEHVPTCFPEEPVFAQSVARFTRACAATQRFRGARIGQLGARPEEFESVWWDEASLQLHFNQTVVPIDLADIFARLDAVSAEESDVRQAMEEIVAGSEIPTEAREAVAVLARLEVALKRLAEEKDLDAMAVNCWEQVQRRYGICVCSVLGRLVDAGYLCSCEVDVYGACSMIAAHAAGLGETPPHFIDWTELHPSRENVWLAWHCGNAPPSLCAAGCTSCITDNKILTIKPSWGLRAFTVKPGPVACCRLVEYDGRFTMFIGTGEVIESEPRTHGSYGWVKVRDVMDWERKMIEHGIIHHGVLVHDPEVAEGLESFCRFSGIEVVRAA